MSTRSNVVIKKTGNKKTVKNVQLYHHHDGYPEGVGMGLVRYFKEILKNEELAKKVLKTPTAFGKWLADDERDDEYRYEGTKISLHGDIEYLYVIDMDTEICYCYTVTEYDCEYQDIITEKTGKLIYWVRFTTTPEEAERIISYIDNED